MLRRNSVEMAHAVNGIKQAVENGDPEDALVLPDHVFNMNRIGTAQGGPTWIHAVLQEK